MYTITKKACIVIAVSASLFLTASCKKDKMEDAKSMLTGTWTYQRQSIKFTYASREFMAYDSTEKYKMIIDKEKVTIQPQGNGNSFVYNSYTYDVSTKKFTMKHSADAQTDEVEETFDIQTLSKSKLALHTTTQEKVNGESAVVDRLWEFVK